MAPFVGAPTPFSKYAAVISGMPIRWGWAYLEIPVSHIASLSIASNSAGGEVRGIYYARLGIFFASGNSQLLRHWAIHRLDRRLIP